MGYTRIATPAEVAARVVPGHTREDDYLEFKADPRAKTDAGRSLSIGMRQSVVEFSE